MSSKKCIIFPGIGYHSDKPLLYYGKKYAKELGYEIIEVTYTGFEGNIRGDDEKMLRAFQHGLKQASDILSKYQFNEEDDIIIISKSIGTAIAAFWQKDVGIKANNIYFTPVDQGMVFMADTKGIVFHGSSDPWASTEYVTELCEKFGFPLYITNHGDHSLETGITVTDILNLMSVYTQVSSYVIELL